MLREIRAFGFEYAELSHGIRISLLPGILEAVEAGEIKISSLHNFCPLPMGAFQAAPNFFQPSSPDSRERDQWLRQTKRSIDFAAQVGATLLVCHLGSVRYLWLKPDRRLESYLRDHPDAVKSGDKAYRDFGVYLYRDYSRDVKTDISLPITTPPCPCSMVQFMMVMFWQGRSVRRPSSSDPDLIAMQSSPTSMWQLAM